MKLHWYAVKPGIGLDARYARIEKADTPGRAYDLAFGRGYRGSWEYKDLGTSIVVIHSDRKRIALLNDTIGWITVKPKRRPDLKVTRIIRRTPKEGGDAIVAKRYMVSFDAKKRDDLRKAYEEAKTQGKTKFKFDGNIILTDYAKYVLEYLDSVLK